MKLTILMGLQATGKSTFFRQKLVDTHIRINRDMLRTNHRETTIFEACLKAKAVIAIDNTNLTRIWRKSYIEPARKARYFIQGFFFESSLAQALERNRMRPGEERVPDLALRGAFRKLERPTYCEGFDQLFFVTIGENNEFVLRDWNDEI